MMLSEMIFKLNKGQKVLIFSHENPDIDAIGSSAALSLVLNTNGIYSLALRSGPLPSGLDYLNPEEIITDVWPGSFDPEAVFILDSEKTIRIGAFFEQKLSFYLGKIPVINIDHHKTNAYFGTSNFVEPDASSTCEILSRDFINSGMKINARVSSLLLAGIVADTGRFRYAHTNIKTMQVVAELMRLGADLYKINEHMERNLSLTSIQRWGEIVNSASELLEGKIVWASVPADIFLNTPEASNIVGSELINFFLRSKQAELAILFVELGDGKIRVSLRSREPVDSTVIAKHFGGGGHIKAAGCQISGTLNEVKSKVTEFACNEFERICESTRN